MASVHGGVAWLSLLKLQKCLKTFAPLPHGRKSPATSLRWVFIWNLRRGNEWLPVMSPPAFPPPFLPTVRGPDPQLARTPSWRAGGCRRGGGRPCARLRLLRLEREWTETGPDWAGWLGAAVPFGLAGDWAAWLGTVVPVRAGRPQGASSSHSVSRDGRNTHQLTCLHDLVSLGFTPHCRRGSKTASG